jgi:hypothetical protein
MEVGTKTRKWLRENFPFLYKRFGKYFHTHYKLRRRILRDAKRHPERYADPELAAAVEYLSRHGLSVFSYPGCGDYDSLDVGVHVDDEGFPWVDHGGRRLYFRPGTDPVSVAGSYRALSREQHPASPHCYHTVGFEFRRGDALFDIGSAEGIYALDNVERASRVFLFETDPKWVGALEKTFLPWKDKVVIINKFASDVDEADSVTVDATVREYDLDVPLLLKMDVEGAERKVLRGAAGALGRKDTRAVVCTYHRQNDHALLSETMRSHGFDVRTSGGRMLFIYDSGGLEAPFFRRGVIYCDK